MIVSALLVFVCFSDSAFSNNVLYAEGVQAFRAGKDMEAAKLLIQAARQSPGCLAVFEDSSMESLPEVCPETGNSRSVYDPAPMVMYRLGIIRWRKETQELERKDILRKNQHSRLLLEDLIRNHPGSPYADDAALLLLEDGLCHTDAGFPDCVMLAISKYESFLATFPASDKIPYALLKISESYLVLAELYGPCRSDKTCNERPWENKARAELFLGQARAASMRILRDHPGSSQVVTAREILDKIESHTLTPALP